MGIISTFVPNPGDIVYKLEKSPFSYPHGRQDKGFAKFSAIPNLWKLMCENRHFPSPDEGKRFLLEHADPHELELYSEEVNRRAEQLYFSFAREMHTFALLHEEESFGSVFYHDDLDFSNVDYVVELSERVWNLEKPAKIAIQSKMRALWFGQRPEDEDPFDTRKRKRREQRGEKEWRGKIYLLTNFGREPACKPSGCWLFGPDHVKDLVDTITKDYQLRGII